MTFQQRNTLVTLASFTTILIFYLISLQRLVANDNFTQDAVVRLWGIVVVLAVFATIAGLILTQGALTAAEVIRTGNSDVQLDDMVDERDKRIDLEGTSLTYTVSSIGSFIAMLTFALGQPALVMFSLLIFFGVSAQILGDIKRLTLYGQG